MPSRQQRPIVYDYAVIGGGIIGLATARAILSRDPHAHLILIEKETALTVHQTGHNSGVIHAGIYYTPKSLKGQTVPRGASCDQSILSRSRDSV